MAVLFGKQERLEEVLGYIGEDFKRDVATDLKSGQIVLVNGTHDPQALLGGIARTRTTCRSRSTSRRDRPTTSEREKNLRGVKVGPLRV